MSNIHRTIVSEYLSKTSGCGIYDRYPDISDRKKWDSLSDELKQALIHAGEEAAKEPWTQLLISDFREFKKTGNRVRFEDKYFPRRRKLNSLVMAECVENKGRFLEDILDGLYLILEETTWCLPPHTSYERDATQEPMPDVTRPIIDLFQAESGAEVAFCEYLLRPVLAGISPYISTYVNERLKERIFTPYQEQHFWWMGNGLEPMCNWTVWCTQNVLICALTREKSFFTEEERRAFIEKAAASCDYFLDTYGDDGGCDEGAQYYSHAGLCLFGCLELMEGALSNSFREIFREKLIRNVATYIVKMHVSGGYYINFADCSALPGRRSAREFLFGKAVEDEALTSFAAADLKEETIEEQLILDEINLFYHVMQAFAYDEMCQFQAGHKLPEDSFFESVGLMVARDEHFVLAAKAGDNGDSHNHNDVGSFTLYKDGKPFIIDLGVGTYTQKTFSDRRYEIWTMQSQYHNLPTFMDGDDIVMQKPGEEYGAADVNCLLCTNTDTGVSSLMMNIAGAYDDKRVASYVRCVSLNKGKNVTVEDTYDGRLPAFLTLMTYEKPEIHKGTRLVIKDVGTIRLGGVHNIEIEPIPITDNRLATAWKHEVYRIKLRVGAGSKVEMLFE